MQWRQGGARFAPVGPLVRVAVGCHRPKRRFEQQGACRSSCSQRSARVAALPRARAFFRARARLPALRARAGLRAAMLHPTVHVSSRTSAGSLRKLVCVFSGRGARLGRGLARSCGTVVCCTTASVGLEAHAKRHVQRQLAAARHPSKSLALLSQALTQAALKRLETRPKGAKVWAC